MKIKQLYEKYQIMPQLAMHMLRVAGIARLITKNWEDREIATKCVNACLVHDMGNMAKFKLDNPLLPIENLEYWQEVQNTFWTKYGHDAHVATKLILDESNLEEYSKYMEEEAWFYANEPTKKDFENAARPVVILLYADLRVALNGVVGMKDRIADLAKRYGGKRPEERWGNTLEEYIESISNSEVSKLSEGDVEPLFDELREFQI